MTQELFEFLLFHLVDNIKLYNLLCDSFPELEKKYIEKEEAKNRALYIPQECLDIMSHNVWQRLCDNFPELDRNKF